jgi:dihydrofolate reductase
MRVSIIVAKARNGVIGVENRLPWHLSDDLKRFKRLTLGHPIIMGRKTFESIGKPLPGRENIVITRQSGLKIEGARVVGSLDEAIDACRKQGVAEAFIIGGAEVYRQALGLADRLYLTIVAADVPGDAYFPEIPEGEFTEIERETSSEGVPHFFVTLDRKS